MLSQAMPGCRRQSAGWVDLTSRPWPSPRQLKCDTHFLKRIWGLTRPLGEQLAVFKELPALYRGLSHSQPVQDVLTRPALPP